MKILFVTPWPLSATGGVSSVVRTLYDEVGRRGHEAAVLFGGETNAIVATDDVAGYRTYSAYLRSPCVESRRLRGMLGFLAFLPLTLWRIHRLLRHEEIDIVSLQYPLPWMLYFGIFRRFSRVPLVITYHGNDAHDLELWSRAERWLVGTMLRVADRGIGVSGSLVEKVREMYPGLATPFEVIHNGVAVEAIDAANDPVETPLPERYAVTVGDLIQRKGIDVLIEAAGKMRDEGNAVDIVAVGDGPQRATFEEMAERLGVRDLFHFVGKRSHPEAMAIVKNGLFFVLASRKEGLPLVIAEAMACRKAVVATEVDGVPMIVADGETGLLAPSENPAALAAAMGKLAADTALRERYAQTGFARALEEFSSKVTVTRHLSNYQAAIANVKQAGWTGAGASGQ